MNVRLLVAASLTLACATTAFAQDAAPATPAPADAPATASDAPQPAAKHHAMKKRHSMHHKSHVAGDPAVIDHSGDKMAVTDPTVSRITIPAQH